MRRLNLDLSDLNFLIFREHNNSSFTKERYTNSMYVLLLNIIKVILRSVYGLSYLNKSKFKNNSRIDFLFYYITSNNKRSLEPVCKYMKKSVLAGPKELNNRASWKYGILYIGKVLGLLKKEKDSYLRKVYISEFVELCLTYCYYHNAKKQLGTIKPDFLILANDHIAHARAFMRVAQELNIKTVYLQHASVSEKFPPLEFDYAFLDGQESYDKYKKIGIRTENIYLMGNPRFDIISNLIRKDTQTIIKKLGISINLLDNWNKIFRLVKSVLECKEINLVVELRPHPAMNIEEIISYFGRLGISISDPKKENPFVFIANNDVFISCESSIHLDTVLADKESLYYSFLDTSRVLDVYGYIKTGLIVDITQNAIEVLSDIINQNFIKYTKNNIKQYYVTNYNTQLWGDSSKEIAKVLLSLN